MKKIINWSFGAFFRTIGRIFAYLVIGVLIMLIGVKFGLKLFIMPIHASTNTSPIFLDEMKIENITPEVPVSGFYLTKQYQITSSPKRILFDFKKVDVPDGTDYLYFTIYFSFHSIPPYSNISINQIDGNFSGTINIPNNALTFSLNSYMVSSAGFPQLCTPSAQNGNFYTFKCAVNDITDFNQIQVTYLLNADFDFNYLKSYDIGILSSAYFDLTNNQINEINKNTEKMAEEAKKTNDTLNDDDTTEADSKISGFFDDFNDNSHGLSSIVTAPLNAVNAMLTTTCTAPSATYKGSTFSFPCGSILWEQEGASALKTFINLIYGGLICYGIAKSLFKDVNDLKNPENDKVEVMNL